MREDGNWRIVYGFPIVLELVSIIVIMKWIPHISIVDLVQGHQQKEAKKLLHSVYKIPKLPEDVLDELLNHMVDDVKSSTHHPEEISLKHAMTDRKYRYGTWNGAIICFLNQMSGISAILSYQGKIFLLLWSTGEFTLLPVIWSIQAVFLVNLVTSFLSSIPSKYWG